MSDSSNIVEEAREEWIEISLDEVPCGVRFDVPGRNQGQIVEVAYGTFGRGEAGETDPYMRVHDRSEPFVVRYYRRGR